MTMLLAQFHHEEREDKQVTSILPPSLGANSLTRGSPCWARTCVKEDSFWTNFNIKWLAYNAADGKQMEISKDLACKNWFGEVV